MATAQAVKTVISQDGRTATVSVPVTFLQRGGRKQILAPPGVAPWSPAPRADTALVKAIVRAHRWRQLLRKRQIQLLDGTGEGRAGERVLFRSYPAPDSDRPRHHRGDSGWTPTVHAAA